MTTRARQAVAAIGAATLRPAARWLRYRRVADTSFSMSNERYFILQSDLERTRAAAERLYAEIASRLRGLLPCSADIRHIGATAIDGCLTKGDLDVVVRVEQQNFLPSDDALASQFSRNVGSIRSASFSAFEDSTTSPHLGIQLTAIGGPEDFFHLFVEALKRDAALVAEYNALKQKFDRRPMTDYRSAKDDFVAKVLASIGGSP
jgi:GrpB-like predicted nucleotidyltransferase (UPF0157 family)